MKRLLATVVMLLVFSVPVWSFSWEKIAAQLAKATFELTTSEGRGYCSGFVIDPDRDYAITAGHCVREGMWVDGSPIGDLLFEDDDLDVAVLALNPNVRPGLKPAKRNPRLGAQIGVYGFALEVGIGAHFRAGTVAGYGEVEGLTGQWLITDQPTIGGMSGGPIVDSDGKVVAVNQRSDRELSALGRSIDQIWSSVRPYWKH